MPKDPPPLTERFLAAVALAEELHGRDRRSGTEIPYLAHLLVVTGLVIEDGGDEDEAIAALLHDAVEDGGGQALLDRITRSFGPHVADIVERLSDSVEVDPDEPWIDRKARYLGKLETYSDESTLRVALADKVHNARSIVRDYRDKGPVLWGALQPTQDCRATALILRPPGRAVRRQAPGPADRGPAPGGRRADGNGRRRRFLKRPASLAPIRRSQLPGSSLWSFFATLPIGPCPRANSPVKPSPIVRPPAIRATTASAAGQCR